MGQRLCVHLFAYLAIGLLALIAGGAIVIWIKSEPTAPIGKIETTNKGNEPNRVVENLTSNQNKPTTATPETTSVPQDTSSDENEARAALDGWVQSLIEHDFDKHIAYYADRLDFYNKKRDADISYVRSENVRLFNKYSQFGLKIRNVKAGVTQMDRS